MEQLFPSPPFDVSQGRENSSSGRDGNETVSSRKKARRDETVSKRDQKFLPKSEIKNYGFKKWF